MMGCRPVITISIYLPVLRSDEAIKARLTFICYPLGYLHHAHSLGDWREGCHVIVEAVVLPFMIP